MVRPVIAIGLDSGDPVLMETWMSQGHLKNLTKLKSQSLYGLVENTVNFADVPTSSCSTERLWSMAWTGCRPDKTGFWDIYEFFPEDYRIKSDEQDVGIDFEEYPPFYALGEEYKVCAFDLPSSGLSEQVNGLQVLAWGGHYPFTPSASIPENVLPELIQKYGKNDVLKNDYGHWSNPKYAKWLHKAVLESIESRTNICKDLMQRDDWDLFVTTFPETHSAGHDLFHLSQPDQPVYSAYKNKVSPDVDPVLETYEAVDEAIGKILAEVPEDAYIVCFSIHGMGNNVTDLLSMAVLPEFMYRYSFPGQVALAPGELGQTPPPVVTSLIRNSWPGEVWVTNRETNPFVKRIKPWIPKQLMPKQHNGLTSPWALGEESVVANWMPAMWFSPLWPQMKAFALPAFADGHIRINLKGRERNGIVLPEEYDQVCDEITDLLHGLKNCRTGEPLVNKVVRTRRYPTEDNDRDKLPGQDLSVLWNKTHKIPADGADSPQFGRIGPFPHARPGGHRSTGFMMAKGAGIEPGHMESTVEGVDIAPTILELLGAPIPDRLDGHKVDAIANSKILVHD